VRIFITLVATGFSRVASIRNDSLSVYVDQNSIETYT